MDPDEVPAWLEIPPASAVAPPVQTRKQDLPLDQLHWEDFERLCVRLVRHEADIEHCQLYGERGQKQHGIDIFARHSGAASYSLYQCKRVENFSAVDIRDAVDKFLRGEWAARASRFVLCLSDSAVRTQYANAIEEQAALLGKRNILLEPWDREKISELLKPHPELVDDFFGREWVKAFCGEEAAQHLSARMDAFAVQRFRRELGQFYRCLFDSQDPGIPIPRKVGSSPFPLDERYVLPDVYRQNAASASSPVVEAAAAPSQTEQSREQDLAASEALPGSEPRGRNWSREPAAPRSYVSREAVEMWLPQSKRSIVVGGPGSGKSSLLRYVITDLFSESPTLSKLAAKFGGLLPVWVPFAFWTKLISAGDRDSSLSSCLKRWLEEWDQQKLWPLVQRAIEDKRLFLLVDGLDEWTDEAAGQIACQKLQVFVQLGDLAAIVVTRAYGYARMPRFGSGWQAADLAILSDKQRSDLCEKWFRLKHLARDPGYHNNLPEVVKHDVDQFLAELSRSPDLGELSRVPFLLLLLLYLRLEQAVLPTRRFKAFELMADRLIADHPASRRTAASLGSSRQGLDENDLRRVLARVAFEVQETRADGLISDRDMQETVRQFLVDGALGLGMESSEARPLLGQFTHIAEGTLGLLVRQATRQLSFFHRSFQEYLAAFHVSRLTLGDQKCVVERRFEDPRWKDVLLSLFSMTRRPDDLRSLVEVMKASTLPQKLSAAELRAELAFGDFDCPADLARSIAEESLVAIERESWMPHRERLLDAALQGLHSAKTAETVRRRVRRWVYARNGWQPGWFAAMGRWPADRATSAILLSGLHDEDPSTQRAAAQSLAAVFRGDPTVGDTLAQLAQRSPRAKLRAAAIEGLALGWPEHHSIPSILAHSDNCVSLEVRLACVGIKVSRGIRADSDFDFLLELSRRRNDFRVHYSWSEEIANALVNGWRGSERLKTICLDTMRNKFDIRDETISQSIAASVLMRGFPRDRDVAKCCGDEIATSQYPFIEMDSHSSPWLLLRDNFQDDPSIGAAIDSWLDRNKFDTMRVALAALVCRTPKAKKVLTEALDGSFPHWPAWGLLEGWGMQDPEVSETLLRRANAPAGSASQIAHLIPGIVAHAPTARARLLEILKDPACIRHDFVVEGFASLSDKGDTAELVSACFAALPRTQGLHRESVEHAMLTCFPEVGKVREFAIGRLSSRHPPIAAAAVAVAGDSQVRAQIAELVQPLPPPLRLRILSKVANQPHDDEFALSVLKDYDVEENDELKTIASIAYHRSLRRIGQGGNAVDRLLEDIVCLGPDHEERRRAAFAGLLVLERVELLRDLREPGGKPELVSIDLGKWNETNLPLVRLVAEKWLYLRSVFGDSLSNRISRWHHDSWPALCRVAADYPELQAEVLSVLDGDRKLAANPHALVFVARAKPASQLLVDRCFAAISAPDSNFPRASFTAAEILAESFAGDDRVYSKLLETMPIARNGPWLLVRPQLAVALSLGWPESPFVDELYRQALREPGSVGDYAAFFETTLSQCPANEFPRRLQRHFAASGVVGNPYISRALIRAVVRRLKRDPEAALALLSALTDSLQPSEKASIARSLATANGLSPELADFCSREIGNQIGLDWPELGFDVASAEVRGVILSLLDALNGPAVGFRFDSGSYD